LSATFRIAQTRLTVTGRAQRPFSSVGSNVRYCGTALRRLRGAASASPARRRQLRPAEQNCDTCPSARQTATQSNWCSGVATQSGGGAQSTGWSDAFAPSFEDSKPSECAGYFRHGGYNPYDRDILRSPTGGPRQKIEYRGPVHGSRSGQRAKLPAVPRCSQYCALCWLSIARANGEWGRVGTSFG
jgi:hypothetical protein